MDISAIALRGLNQALTRFDQAAQYLASAGAASPRGPTTDTVDLSATALSILAARSQAAANLQTVKVGGDIERQAIDLLAGRDA